MFLNTNIKRAILILVAIFVYANLALAQSVFEITGTIYDNNEQPLVGAAIYSKQKNRYSTISDSQGEYMLSIASGKHLLVVTYGGFETIEMEVEVDGNKQINFTMKELVLETEDVVITSISVDDRVSNVHIGAEKIEISEMIKTPVLFGEKDVIKSITLLPGVKSESEGSSGFQVRGGTSAQNLILLDDAPIYNSGHVMGIFSVFNDAALQNASLYKGQIPAQFGGATSAVFDVNSRAGSRQDYKFGFDIGLLSAKVAAEGPIVEDKASFIVTARRSYFDLFLKATEEYKDNIINFYDINVKLNSSLGDKSTVSLSYFTGSDRMAMSSLMDMGWSNQSAVLDWQYKYSENLSSKTSAVWSTYDFDNSIEMNNVDYKFDGYIKSYALKHEFQYTPSDVTFLRFGVQTKFNDMCSADWELDGYTESEIRYSWENSVWINDEWAISDKLKLSIGLRFSTFSALGGNPYYTFDSDGEIIATIDDYYSVTDVVETYYQLEPRLSFNYRITENHSIKSGYSRNSQNIHAIRNSSTSLPFDRYAMSSNVIKPQISDQVSLGYSALTADFGFEFSVEGYYKSIQNVYDYVDGKTFGSAIEIESIINGGDGRSYGVEFFAKKKSGAFTGWIGYTLSWSQNRIEGINNNQWYTASNDRRHDVSIVGMYELSSSWDMSLAWIYNTGQAISAPSAKYEINDEVIYYYAEKNGYRAPDYHRMDISFTNTKKLKKCIRQWSFGVYNLYNRYNPYMIVFNSDDASATGTTTTQYSLFGFLPSVSYGIKF